MRAEAGEREGGGVTEIRVIVMYATLEHPAATIAQRKSAGLKPQVFGSIPDAEEGGEPHLFKWFFIPIRVEV